MGNFAGRRGLSFEMYGLRPHDYGSQKAGGEERQRDEGSGWGGKAVKQI